MKWETGKKKENKSRKSMDFKKKKLFLWIWKKSTKKEERKMIITKKVRGSLSFSSIAMCVSALIFFR